MKVLVGVTVALAALVAVSVAPAHTEVRDYCHGWKAKVSAADAQNVLDYSPRHIDGAPLQGTTLPWGNNFFETTAPVTVHWGSVTYNLSSGSVFGLGCASVSKGGASWPGLFLGSGRAEVTDPAGTSGEVITLEGLFGPITAGPLSFTVTRRPTKPLADTKAKFLSSSNFVNSPRGKTVVEMNGRGVVNVTPYVGEGPGHCRHCHAAELSSVGARFTMRGSSGGTAHYR